MEGETERSGMEKAYPWKKQIREAVVSVSDRCCRARNLLLAAPHVEAPRVISTGDAVPAADLIALAEKLRDASSSLADAAATMEAAELLALRGGGDSPAAPLRSIDFLLLNNYNENTPLWRALSSLQKARARAEDSFGAMERCRGHLCAATLLLGHPDVPGVDDCIDAERAAAASALEAAQKQAEEIEKLVGAARKVLGATAASREAPPGSASEDV